MELIASVWNTKNRFMHDMGRRPISTDKYRMGVVFVCFTRVSHYATRLQLMLSAFIHFENREKKQQQQQFSNACY